MDKIKIGPLLMILSAAPVTIGLLLPDSFLPLRAASIIGGLLLFFTGYMMWGSAKARKCPKCGLPINGRASYKIKNGTLHCPRCGTLLQVGDKTTC